MDVRTGRKDTWAGVAASVRSETQASSTGRTEPSMSCPGGQPRMRRSVCSPKPGSAGVN